MWPTLLIRRTLREGLVLSLFYLTVFIGLIIVALIVPLMRSGAPPLAVLATLPDQMALPGTIALPLALVTAILGVIGRMREQGELIAIQAAGVSTWRLCLALLPMAVICAVLAGLLSHVVLPDAFAGWRAGKASLLRQAIATNVARREFIYKDSAGLSVAASGVDGSRLDHVFARRRDDNGAVAVLYAPSAQWVSSSSAEDGALLQLAFHDARMLSLPGQDQSGASTTYGNLPSLTIELAQLAKDFSHKADTKTTPQLADTIDAVGHALAVLDQASDPGTFARIYLDEVRVQPLSPESVKWPVLGRIARSNELPDILKSLPLPLLAQCQAITTTPDSATQSQLANALWQHFMNWPTQPRLVRLVPTEVPKLAASAQNPGLIARQLLDLHLRSALHTDPVTWPLSKVFRHWNTPNYQRKLRSDYTEELREHQMAWHLRWQIAVLPLAYWVFACGLGLTISSSNRLVAVGIGLGTVMITLLPGVGLTKSVGDSLAFNPGWLMWSTWLVVGSAGCYLLWKRR